MLARQPDPCRRRHFVTSHSTRFTTPCRALTNQRRMFLFPLERGRRPSRRLTSHNLSPPLAGAGIPQQHRQRGHRVDQHLLPLSGQVQRRQGLLQTEFSRLHPPPNLRQVLHCLDRIHGLLVSG
jgi:hypothetical protein